MEVPKCYGNVLQYVTKNRSEDVILEVSGNDTVVSDNEQVKGYTRGNTGGGRVVFLRAIRFLGGR